MPVAAAGDTTVAVTWTPPTATDNVAPVNQINNPLVTHSPGDPFPIGLTAVSYIFQDAAGNRDTCSFNVIVTRECLFVITYVRYYVHCIATGESFVQQYYPVKISIDSYHIGYLLHSYSYCIIPSKFGLLPQTQSFLLHDVY